MSRQFWGELLAWATASGTAISNSTTETILFPNITIPANYLQDGRTVRIKAWGQISNIVTSQPTITFRFRWGGVAGTVLCASAALTASATAFTNAIWELEIMLTVRANGSSGTVMAIGSVCAGDLATIAPNYLGSAGATSPAAVTVDLTADTALALTAQWSAASASNSIQGINYYVEAMN